MLASAERARSERFHHEVQKRRFIAARGALRWLLGGYLDVAPDAIQFEYEENGRPFLAACHFHDHHHASDIVFNLSHSGHLALVAITSGRAVGVDVERIRRRMAVRQLAQRFFSQNEYHALKEIRDCEARKIAFFHCWVRKEAYLKAKGRGVFRRLDRFEVSIPPNAPALFRDIDDADAASQWSIMQLEIEPGFAAALAVFAPHHPRAALVKYSLERPLDL